MSGIAFIDEDQNYFLADLFSSNNRTGQDLSDQCVARFEALGITEVVKAKTRFLMQDMGSVATRAAKNIKKWLDTGRSEADFVQLQYCCMHTVSRLSRLKKPPKIS